MKGRNPSDDEGSVPVAHPPPRRGPDLARAGAAAVVRLAGRDLADEDEVLAVGRQLFGLLDAGCRALVVSLAGAEGVGTALVGKLVMVHNRAEAAGGRLALCGVPPHLSRALEVAGLARLFAIYPTEQEALAGCGVSGV
jgi:anti-anti-sigma factor